jgi:hypothetical protein
VAIPLGDINGDGFDDMIAAVQDNVGDFSQIRCRRAMCSSACSSMRPETSTTTTAT